MRQTNLPGFSSYRPRTQGCGARNRSDELNGDKAMKSPPDLKSAEIGEPLPSPKPALAELLR